MSRNCGPLHIALGWYLRRVKVPIEPMQERLARMERANTEQDAETEAFVLKIADILEDLRDGLDDLDDDEPIRRKWLDEKITELERG